MRHSCGVSHIQMPSLNKSLKYGKRNAISRVFRISVFRRTFAAETFAIVKLYIKWVIYGNKRI